MVNQCFGVEKHWLNPNPWSIIRQLQKVPPCIVPTIAEPGLREDLIGKLREALRIFGGYRPNIVLECVVRDSLLDILWIYNSIVSLPYIDTICSFLNPNYIQYIGYGMDVVWMLTMDE
jgi:hypothetical protein